MRILIILALIVGLAGAPAFPAGGQCGTERWAVKTLADPDAWRVILAPTLATVERLIGLPVPNAFGPTAARLTLELQTYTVTTTLVEFKQEADQDFHLVLRGTSGRTMIAEIPDPGCVQGSRVAAQIAKARAQFIARFGHPSRTAWRQTNTPVAVTGVLFFDLCHGQRGVAPNCVELHPVIGFMP